MLIEITQDIIEHLSKTELSVVQYINEKTQELPQLSIVDIAFETYTSPATVSRAIRKCGLAGFSELRFRSLKKTKNNAFSEAGEIIQQSLKEIEAITECVSIGKLIQITTLVQNAAKIYVLGRGLSEYVAEEFSMKLQLLGLDSMAIRDPNIMRLLTKSVKRDHLIINFSLNGQTPELITAAQNAKNNGADVVTLCCSQDSPLLQLSTVALVGYSDPNSAISNYEVRSRLPLHVMSRILLEHVASHIIID